MLAGSKVTFGKSYHTKIAVCLCRKNLFEKRQYLKCINKGLLEKNVSRLGRFRAQKGSKNSDLICNEIPEADEVKFTLGQNRQTCLWNRRLR